MFRLYAVFNQSAQFSVIIYNQNFIHSEMCIRDRRITTRGISGQLKKLAVKYGINPVVVYPHSFRHRFAKSFLDRCNDIAFLACLLYTSCYVAYGKKPLTRKERANNVKKKDFFSKYSADAQAVLDILLDKYMNQGITEVEDIKVLSLADFANYGKPAKIVKLFGGKAQYEAAVRELEASIYEEVEVG